MFQLSREEFENLKPQFVTSNAGGALRSQSVTLKRGQHLKYLPYAFTEQGVAMLSACRGASAPCRSTWLTCSCCASDTIVVNGLNFKAQEKNRLTNESNT